MKPFIATVELAGPFKILARQIWIKADDRALPATGDPIVPQTVQAGSSDTGSEVANLISRDGLRDRDADGLEEHGTDPARMWQSAKGQAATWVEFDFGETVPLGTICIWNFNDSWHTDRGVRQADISFWTPEKGWQKPYNDQPFEQAEGGDDYDDPLYMKLENVTAQKVRFDDLSSFGDPDYVGLSKVQFFSPLGPQAVRPVPRDGATGVNVSDLELTWVPGERAQTHSVCLGTRPDDLKPLGRIEQVGAKMSQLNAKTKYYWRIDEVQSDGSLTSGKLWSFTTGGGGFAAWWKLDETEGVAVADSSGNGHHAMTHGDPVWQPTGGHTGGALQFDGIDDYVDTGWAENLPVWTVSTWVKSPEAPKAPVASGPVHREKNYQISWDHGDAQCRGAALVCVGGTWHAAGFGDLKADTWYHLLATYDGENLRAYRDGVLITDNTDPSGDADPESATLKLGRHATATTAFFAGTIDDVCIFARPLDANEVAALHSGGDPAQIACPKAPPAPHLAQATLPETAAPVAAVSSLAAQVEPQAEVQPADTNAVGQTTTEAEDVSGGGGRNIVAVILILVVVGLIAGVSRMGKKTT